VRRPALLAAAVCAAALAGCGDRTPSDEEQVRTVLQQFARAAEQHDYTTMCDDVFAPKLLTGLREIGLPCVVAMRNAFGAVQNPRLTVGDVTVKGRTASAQVRTAAENQAPSSDRVRLDKVAAGWRISALSGAPAAG
jgi:hypothetical protein